MFIAQVAFFPSFRNRAHWVVHSTLFVALLIKGHMYVMCILLSMYSAAATACKDSISGRGWKVKRICRAKKQDREEVKGWYTAGSWTRLRNGKPARLKNRICDAVLRGQSVLGCVSVEALRLELVRRGEEPAGYHNT